MEHNKKELRIKLKQIRAQIQPNIADEKIRNNFLKHISPEVGAVIATYIPTQSELDVNKLNRALGYCGYNLCLPCVEGQNMVFRKWGIYTELEPNQYGIMQPSQKSEIINPKYIIVPTLGFNAQKYRIGYGGGYYDRYFAANLNIIKIGVAYAACEVPENFQQPHDIALDYIITEVNVV